MWMKGLGNDCKILLERDFIDGEANESGVTVSEATTEGETQKVDADENVKPDDKKARGEKDEDDVPRTDLWESQS